MRRILAAVLAAALALTLCACNEQPPAPTPSLATEPVHTPTPTQPFVLGYDPDSSLHPITGDDQVNLDLASLVYEGLYELDNTFTAHPVLARSAEVSEDGLTWTITLKRGARFSDGTPLTADHVAASLTLARDSALYAGRLGGVTGATAVDGAVVITLSAPNGDLPALLDIPVTLERETGLPLGTGRFRYSEEEDGLCLRPNGNHDGAPLYDRIPLHPMTSADERIAAFDSGLVSAVVTDFSSPYALGYSGSYETSDFPTTGMVYVGFRTDDGPCRSPEVRRAFSMAFDRVSVVRSLLAGHGDPASLPISPLHSDYDSAAAARLEYDIQGAAALLDEAGWPLGEDGLRSQGAAPLAVTLAVNSDSPVKLSIADYLARSLTGLGVTVTVDKLSWQEYTAVLAAGRFDLYIGEVRLTGDFDPSTLLTGSLNYGRFSGDGIPALLSQWRAAQGAARTQAAKQLWAALAEQAPIAPICFKRGSVLLRWGMASSLQPTRGDPFRGLE